MPEDTVILDAARDMRRREEQLADALVAVEDTLTRYIVFPSAAHYLAVTLWIAHTFMFDLWDATMYLAITSPEKQSGKTRLLEVLELFAFSPERAEMASPAALFTIASGSHTMLVDEVDAVFATGDKSETGQAIRGILNTGNRRGGSVPRVHMNGQQRTVERFNTFGPKALAGIKSLPETLADRSIEVRMKRKTPDEKVEAFRMRPAKVAAMKLREELANALTENREVISAWRVADNLDVAGLSDRQLEGWEPLFAIAGAVGWFHHALDAAQALTSSARERETPESALLLMHVRDAFDAADSDRLTTDELLRYLRHRDDGPWAERYDDAWDMQNLKSAQKLARLLHEYDVKPKRLRVKASDSREDVRVKGYLRDDFLDAWRRWLP